MTDKTDSKEREAFEAWRSDLPYQGATQLQKEAFIAGFRAAIEQGGSGAAIAEIGSAAGEDAEFGQRAIYPLVDIDRFEYGTKLYARASLAASAGSEPVATVFTMEALAPGGGMKYHATVHKPLPAGTQLYLHPSPPEGMVGGWIALPGALPEPGTPVLLDIGKKYPIRAMWAAKHTVQAADDDTDWGEYVEADDMYYAPEGWYEWNECEETHWRVTETPRAWAPLPPTTSAGSGKGE